MWDTARLDGEELMKKQLAWIFGGVAIVGLGMASSLSACSSDDSGAPDGSNPKDSTTPTDTGTKDTSTTDTGPGDAGPNDTGTGCEVSVPANAPFTTDAGPYCPFQGDGSTFGACNNGQHCCVTTAQNNCSDTACPDADVSDFQCNETNDCPSGNVCCEVAGSTVKGPDPGCSYDFVSGQKGAVCVQGTACPTGQPQICGAASDCNVAADAGNTCYPLDTKAMWLGVCHTPDGGTL
jgi:hypothetical protein